MCSSDLAWRAEWAVEQGFTMARDSRGYEFPTAIAFVPHPGRGPGDPLYFVTEIKGRIKVVTNDRSVHLFAKNFVRRPPGSELPSESGEVGLAGICLDPAHGYVFATFAFVDSNGVTRNNIVRFETRPGSLATTPTRQREFSEIFRRARSAVSHQIGPCQVHDGLLYVSVGDGAQPFEGQNPGSVLGKVLRMTLDGKPVRSNPFYVDTAVANARNFVWAYGLRNPFSLKVVEGRVFVADNGPAVDRFTELEPRENALYDGSDWSMGTHAAAVFVPSPAPVQMDYDADAAGAFPQTYARHFFLATAGLPATRGVNRRGAKGVVTFEYGFPEHKVRSVARSFLRYRGSGYQSVVGLAFGPDGLYVVPLFPSVDGSSAVLKISYDPAHQHPYLVADNENPLALFGEKGCFSCHSLYNQGGSVGPTLDREALLARLQVRLQSPEYRASLDTVNRRQDEPFPRYRAARDSVARGTGLAQVRKWVRYRLEEPRFDNPSAQMPNLRLSAQEATILTDFLVPEVPPRLGGYVGRLLTAVRDSLPSPRYRHVALAFVVGFALSWVLQTLRTRRPRGWDGRRPTTPNTPAT